MTRNALLLSVLVLAASVCGFGQILDPVGFCPVPATVTTCTTANGFGGETIGVGATQFGMMKNGGGGTAVDPWVLLVAVPNDVGGAPVITSDGGAFTQIGATANDGMFLPTTAGSLYAFAGLTGDSSMRASNMFCDGASYPCLSSNEITAFGSLPTFFQVFAYTFHPQIAEATPYSFSVGGTGLTGGTFLAAAGGTNPFTTPYTTTGLVNGPGCTPGTCGGGGQGGVPEPGTIILLGSGLVITFATLRKKLVRS